MYRGCWAAVAEVLSLVLTKYPRGVRGDCVLQHHQHIDKVLGLMRNNYNLFAHHSKTEKKKRYLSARCLSSTPTLPYSPLSLLTPCRSVAFSCLPNDECNRWWWRPKKQERKKGGDTCFIYLYFAVGARLVASRQNFKVGIINSNAPFWVPQLGPELDMEMEMGWRRSWCRWVAATTSRDGDWCSEWTKLPKQSDWQHLLLPSKRPGVAWLASSPSPSDWLLF